MATEKKDSTIQSIVLREERQRKAQRQPALLEPPQFMHFTYSKLRAFERIVLTLWTIHLWRAFSQFNSRINQINMKIKTLFKTLFCVGLVLTLVLYLLHLYGNYIERTQEPIIGYTYNGYEEKINYKSSNIIFITYKSKQYTLHTGNKVLDKIKFGDFPKLY